MVYGASHPIYLSTDKHENICINEAFAWLPRGNAFHCVNLQKNTEWLRGREWGSSRFLVPGAGGEERRLTD